MKKPQKTTQQRENGLIPATKSNENQPSNTKATTQNSDLFNIKPFKILIDNGKPYEITAQDGNELFKILTEQYQESKKTDYAYFDIKVFNDKDEDISESQFINEMISDIMDEDGQNE